MSLWYVGELFPTLFFRVSTLRFLSVFTFAFVLCLFPQIVYSADVTVAWDPNTEPDLAGYLVYYGTSSRTYPFSIDVDNSTIHTISDLAEGRTYYFAVTAYDFNGNESDFSEEISLYLSENGGEVFGDVPPGYWAEDAIYKIYDAGITKGCSQNPLLFCPDTTVTRSQMAIFLEKATHGSDFNPPMGSGVFDDVPVNHWAADWIEQFYNDGITSGCSKNPLLYCPDGTVTRAQMAVFLLRAEHGSSYTPPSANGIFVDVPVNNWAAAWVEQLFNEGITSGCSNNPLLYCPDGSVTRAQMAVFLVRTFGL